MAAAAAGFAAWFTHGEKVAAERSAAAAEQSAAEAARAADSAAQLVEIEKARRSDEEAASEDRAVVFRVIGRGRVDRMLINQGHRSAYGVRVEAEGMISEGRTEFDEFRAGESVDYKLSCPAPLRVSWHLEPDLSDPVRHATLQP